jgi:hypothetical protein
MFPNDSANRFETSECQTRSARIKRGFLRACPYILDATFFPESWSPCTASCPFFSLSFWQPLA